LIGKYSSTNKSDYNTYRKWIQTGYLNRHCSTNLKGREKEKVLEKDGKNNFILRVKEQASRVSLKLS